MRIDVHVHQEPSSEVLDLLRQIADRLSIIDQKENEAMLDLTGLQQSVANVDTVAASAVVLLKELAAELAANAGNQQAVAQIAADLNAHAEALSQAIVENTPAAPANPEPPAQPPAPPPEPGITMPGDTSAGARGTAHDASVKTTPNA